MAAEGGVTVAGDRDKSYIKLFYHVYQPDYLICLPAIANDDDDIFFAHGYRLSYRYDYVSQYVSDVKPFVNINLFHALRQLAISMLQRARKMPVFAGQYEIPVIIPEDLTGLKLQAAMNNPERKMLDDADIELLLAHFHNSLDWEIVEEYFTLFGVQEHFHVLKAKYGKT